MAVEEDPLYYAYMPLVEMFRELYLLGEPNVVSLGVEEIRLIWLALATSKANLKKFDPAKGLNQ